MCVHSGLIYWLNFTYLYVNICELIIMKYIKNVLTINNHFAIIIVSNKGVVDYERI